MFVNYKLLKVKTNSQQITKHSQRPPFFFLFFFGKWRNTDRPHWRREEAHPLPMQKAACLRLMVAWWEIRDPIPHEWDGDIPNGWSARHRRCVSRCHSFHAEQQLTAWARSFPRTCPGFSSREGWLGAPANSVALDFLLLLWAIPPPA